MNTHLALQFRVHDYEQRKSEQDALRPADCNENHAELDGFEAAAGVEVEVEVEVEAEGECMSDAPSGGFAEQTNDDREVERRSIGEARTADEQVQQHRVNLVEEWRRCPLFL